MPCNAYKIKIYRANSSLFVFRFYFLFRLPFHFIHIVVSWLCYHTIMHGFAFSYICVYQLPELRRRERKKKCEKKEKDVKKALLRMIYCHFCHCYLCAAALSKHGFSKTHTTFFCFTISFMLAFFASLLCSTQRFLL